MLMVQGYGWCRPPRVSQSFRVADALASRRRSHWSLERHIDTHTDTDVWAY